MFDCCWTDVQASIRYMKVEKRRYLLHQTCEEHNHTSGQTQTQNITKWSKMLVVKYLALMRLLITKAAVWSSLISPGVTAGGAGGAGGAAEPAAEADSRRSPTPLGISSLRRPAMWCFTIISSKVFRGELRTCNDRDVSLRLVCVVPLPSSHYPAGRQVVSSMPPVRKHTGRRVFCLHFASCTRNTWGSRWGKVSWWISHLVLSVETLYVEDRPQVGSVVDAGLCAWKLLIHTADGSLQSLHRIRSSVYIPLIQSMVTPPHPPLQKFDSCVNHGHRIWRWLNIKLC